MAYVEEALFAMLSADADIAAVVGARIYPKAAPQGTAKPLLVYEKVSGVRVDDHDGSDLAAPRISVRSHASSYTTVVGLSNKVRLALNGFVGTQSGVPMSIRLANELDAPYDPETHTYTRVIDFIVHHNE